MAQPRPVFTAGKGASCTRLLWGNPRSAEIRWGLQEAQKRWPVDSQAAGSVLLVGNPALPLKGFDVAIKTLTTVNRVLPVSVTWICQTQPTAATVPSLVGSGLNIDLYVSPRQVRRPTAWPGTAPPPSQRLSSMVVDTQGGHGGQDLGWSGGFRGWGEAVQVQLGSSRPVNGCQTSSAACLKPVRASVNPCRCLVPLCSSRDAACLCVIKAGLQGPWTCTESHQLGRS